MSNSEIKHDTKESIFYGMAANLLIGALCVRAANVGSPKTIEGIKPPFVFSISTLTPDDKPLAGVKVRCLHPRAQRGRAIVDMIAESNDKGIAEFNVTQAGILLDRYFWFSLADENFVGSPHVGISPIDNEYTYTLRVLPAEQFGFLVLDEHGKPIPEAKLWLFSDHPSFPRVQTGMFRAVTSTTTDARGLAGVTFAQIETNIIASAKGRASAFIRGASLPKDEPYTIRLSPGCNIAGRIVNAENDPVENVKLSATNKDLIVYYMKEFTLEATSDAEGGFVLENALEGTYEIQARMQEPYETMYAKPVSVKVEGNASVAGLKIIAQNGALLKGRYVTKHKLRTSDRAIFINIFSPIRQNWEIQTNDDGSFVIPGLPQNARGTISFRGVSGYHTSVTMSNKYPFFHVENNEIRFDAMPPGAYEGVQVEFLLLGLATGRIFDSSGDPMPGKRLVVRPGGRIYRTNDNGEYTAKIPPNERVTLEVMDPATGRVIVKCEPFRIEEGQVIEKDLTVGAESSKLVDQPLPTFEGIDIDFETQQARGKMLLVCFWDMQQRPSRNCMIQLSKKVQELKEEEVVVIAVHASKIEQGKLDDWISENENYLPVGFIVSEEEKVRFNWGINSLPWLILTDKRHIVVAEGFGLDELDERIKETQNAER